MTQTNDKLIEGRTGPWEIVLGLEIHAQVASKAKLFSGAAVGFGAGPNEQVSLVDAAMPGMLPVINGFCVEQAVRAGLGIGFCADYMARNDPDVLPVLPGLLKIPPLPIWLAVHREIRTSTRIRAVYDFLADALPKLL